MEQDSLWVSNVTAQHDWSFENQELAYLQLKTWYRVDCEGGNSKLGEIQPELFQVLSDEYVTWKGIPGN